MRIICAPDSFKESITATNAAQALRRGILSAEPSIEVTCLPIADGGEGTMHTLVNALDGDTRSTTCTDALGRPINATFGLIHTESTTTAVIEMAAAAGIEHISPHERNICAATTYGVGQLITAALDAGAHALLIGIGGSATNDAGTGMMSALGARFLDAEGNQLPPGGSALRNCAHIDITQLDRRLAKTKIMVACDVNNPLLGKHGASAVFGPQKGATPEDIIELEHALTRWADIVETTLNKPIRNTPGAGAAGGVGAAFLAFTSAELRPGAQLVMDAINIDQHLHNADYVFTGEGSVDTQSMAGKAPMQVAHRAAQAGVPTVVFAGRIEEKIARTPPAGVIATVPIVREATDLPTALAAGEQNLEAAAAMVTRLLHADLARKALRRN
ncbi:glycerate kinase [Dermatophilus congolensis]|uniref:Glycerate kinase n=1 Tax=Dermatophilus congolensis TaxID=1863 RepID=A0A239VBX4_9MICO|nr:glycerate kinase [Dermatophilus congolensis]MBO3128555.1 glycerate kinase [Dermatophilus congolensis]MBO3132808.1 glycerate kinase [Dermatophilus congolensis]MBO3133033.1 glycerate kinase [Dermatophilus congolensis]MBO3135265.1 glycerate kinase [Dermatophilus congolensis]MBO3137507.1 glycerate kinase [Dermatophilus congolensis]